MNGRESFSSEVELTGFVGREHELEEITRLVGRHRLVTLTGPGGIGKTRLALRAADQLAGQYKSGVSVIHVGEIANQQLLTQAVFGAVGLNDRTRRWREAVLSEFLRERHILLVFDECEHMLEACALLFLTLLHECPRLHILATSRQPVAVNGEARLRIPPLSVPDQAARTAEAALSFESVRLFVERGAAADPSFVINEANCLAVAELCRRLDGIPLALELMAVRLDACSVDQLIEGLDHQLALLEPGDRGRDHRHQTLRATIDWSYQTLSVQERSLWTRLAIFSADFGLQAATIVCHDAEFKEGEVASLLGTLVEKSMVIRQLVQGAERYRLLEPMRQFAIEQPLFRAAETELTRRLVGWIAELAHAAHSPARQSANFQRVQLESPSVWKAIDVCQHEQDYAEQGISILYDLSPYFGNRGSLPDARRAVELLLQHVEPDTAGMAKGLFAAGLFGVNLRDMAAAKLQLTESIRISRLLGDPKLVAWCLFYLASIAWEEGDRATELDHTRQMLELSRAMQNEFEYSAALWRLGLIEIEAGDAATGIKMVDEALAISRDLNEEYFSSLELWSLAFGHMRLGQLKPAEAAGREALELAAGLGDGHSLAMSSECLAWIAAERRDAVKAARLLGYATEMWKSMGGRLFPPLIRYRDRCESYSRAALGDERFSEEVRRGEGLSQVEVIRLASVDTPGKLDASVRAWVAAPANTQPELTMRESEIARMVAAGLTNKEIAAELLISTRTVEAHVGHILNKLGLTSRIQLASWVAMRKLVGPSAISAS